MGETREAYARSQSKPVFEAKLGFAGDRTEHLYWRLQNGEGPKDLKPRAAVLLIGTNDLTNVFDVRPYPLKRPTNLLHGRV